MNASTIKYQVLKPDTYLDCAEFSLCPSCSSNIIKLVDDGMRDTSRIPCCSICGWSDRDKLQGGKNQSLIPFLVIDRPNLLIPAKRISLQKQVGIMTHACTSKNFRSQIKDLNLIKVCDSGVFLKASNQQNLTYEQLFDRYEEMGVDYGIIFDVLGNAIATIESAKCAIALYRSSSRSFKLIGVAQGQTIEEYVACTQKLIDLGYEHIAIGGLLRKNNSSARYVRVKNEEFLIQVLSSIRKVWSGWLFCLGCYHPKRQELFDKYRVFGSDSKRWAFKCNRGLSTEDRHEQLIRNFLGQSSASSSISTILQGGDKNCAECVRPQALDFKSRERTDSSNKFDTLENKLAVPCLIKQPKQPEVKGIIQKVWRDRFTVYIPSNGSTINVSKLLVYPDFSGMGDELLQGGQEKCSSNKFDTLDNCSSKNGANSQKVSDTSNKCSSKNDNPPCTKNSKTRRHKGEGSGHIYYRTVTRNGRNYQQAYYQWRTEGKQRTKYIPKKLLRDIEEAKEQKLPVTKILELLQGGLNICSSNSSKDVLAKSKSDEINPECSSKIIDPPCNNLENEEDSKNRGCSKSLDVLAIDKSVGTISNNCSSNYSNPPCTKKKRSAGCGGGYVEYREVKRNHKVYAQYWYHYEFWENGRCIEKKSKYIPKRVRSRIERMNYDKAPVNEILKVLRGKRKK